MKKCPECAAGKHQNCFGVADLTDDDQVVVCECDNEADHPLRDEELYYDDDSDEDRPRDWGDDDE